MELQSYDCKHLTLRVEPTAFLLQICCHPASCESEDSICRGSLGWSTWGEYDLRIPSRCLQAEREREGAEPLSRKLQGDTNRRPANCGCALAHGGSDLDAVATPKPCRERERERECKIPLYNLDSYEQPGGQSLSQSTHNTQASFVHQAVVQS